MTSESKWKLVPVEPTPEMIEAGDVANPTAWNEDTDLGFGCDVAFEVYRAMLAASPQPPAPGAEAAARETRGPYEARHCAGVPASVCDYGVVSLSAGIEVCRVWKEQDARAISDLLNATPPTAEEITRRAREEAADPALAARFARLHGICERIKWVDVGKPAMADAETRKALDDLAEYLFMAGIDEALAKPPGETGAGQL